MARSHYEKLRAYGLGSWLSNDQSQSPTKSKYQITLKKTRHASTRYRDYHDQEELSEVMEFKKRGLDYLLEELNKSNDDISKADWAKSSYLSLGQRWIWSHISHSFITPQLNIISKQLPVYQLADGTCYPHESTSSLLSTDALHFRYQVDGEDTENIGTVLDTRATELSLAGYQKPTWQREYLEVLDNRTGTENSKYPDGVHIRQTRVVDDLLKLLMVFNPVKPADMNAPLFYIAENADLSTSGQFGDVLFLTEYSKYLLHIGKDGRPMTMGYMTRNRASVSTYGHVVQGITEAGLMETDELQSVIYDNNLRRSPVAVAYSYRTGLELTLSRASSKEDKLRQYVNGEASPVHNPTDIVNDPNYRTMPLASRHPLSHAWVEAHIQLRKQHLKINHDNNNWKLYYDFSPHTDYFFNIIPKNGEVTLPKDNHVLQAIGILPRAEFTTDIGDGSPGMTSMYDCFKTLAEWDEMEQTLDIKYSKLKVVLLDREVKVSANLAKDGVARVDKVTTVLTGTESVQGVLIPTLDGKHTPHPKPYDVSYPALMKVRPQVINHHATYQDVNKVLDFHNRLYLGRLARQKYTSSYPFWNPIGDAEAIETERSLGYDVNPYDWRNPDADRGPLQYLSGNDRLPIAVFNNNSELRAIDQDGFLTKTMYQPDMFKYGEQSTYMTVAAAKANGIWKGPDHFIGDLWMRLITTHPDRSDKGVLEEVIDLPVSFTLKDDACGSGYCIGAVRKQVRGFNSADIGLADSSAIDDLWREASIDVISTLHARIDTRTDWMEFLPEKYPDKFPINFPPMAELKNYDAKYQFVWMVDTAVKPNKHGFDVPNDPYPVHDPVYTDFPDDNVLRLPALRVTARVDYVRQSFYIPMFPMKINNWLWALVPVASEDDFNKAFLDDLRNPNTNLGSYTARRQNYMPYRSVQYRNGIRQLDINNYVRSIYDGGDTYDLYGIMNYLHGLILSDENFPDEFRKSFDKHYLEKAIWNLSGLNQWNEERDARTELTVDADIDDLAVVPGKVSQKELVQKRFFNPLWFGELFEAIKEEMFATEPHVDKPGTRNSRYVNRKYATAFLEQDGLDFDNFFKYAMLEGHKPTLSDKRFADRLAEDIRSFITTRRDEFWEYSGDVCTITDETVQYLHPAYNPDTYANPQLDKTANAFHLRDSGHFFYVPELIRFNMSFIDMDVAIAQSEIFSDNYTRYDPGEDTYRVYERSGYGSRIERYTDRHISWEHGDVRSGGVRDAYEDGVSGMPWLGMHSYYTNHEMRTGSKPMDTYIGNDPNDPNILMGNYYRYMPVVTPYIRQFKYFMEPYFFAADKRLLLIDDAMLENIMTGGLDPKLDVRRIAFYLRYPPTEEGIRSLFELIRSYKGEITKRIVAKYNRKVTGPDIENQNVKLFDHPCFGTFQKYAFRKRFFEQAAKPSDKNLIGTYIKDIYPYRFDISENDRDLVFYPDGATSYINTYRMAWVWNHILRGMSENGSYFVKYRYKQDDPCYNETPVDGFVVRDVNDSYLARHAGAMNNRAEWQGYYEHEFRIFQGSVMGDITGQSLGLCKNPDVIHPYIHTYDSAFKVLTTAQRDSSAGMRAYDILDIYGDRGLTSYDLVWLIRYTSNVSYDSSVFTSPWKLLRRRKANLPIEREDVQILAAYTGLLSQATPRFTMSSIAANHIGKRLTEGSHVVHADPTYRPDVYERLSLKFKLSANTMQAAIVKAANKEGLEADIMELFTPQLVRYTGGAVEFPYMEVSMDKRSVKTYKFSRKRMVPKLHVSRSPHVRTGIDKDGELPISATNGLYYRPRDNVYPIYPIQKSLIDSNPAVAEFYRKLSAQFEALNGWMKYDDASEPDIHFANTQMNVVVEVGGVYLVPPYIYSEFSRRAGKFYSWIARDGISPLLGQRARDIAEPIYGERATFNYAFWIGANIFELLEYGQPSVRQIYRGYSQNHLGGWMNYGSFKVDNSTWSLYLMAQAPDCIIDDQQSDSEDRYELIANWASTGYGRVNDTTRNPQWIGNKQSRWMTSAMEVYLHRKWNTDEIALTGLSGSYPSDFYYNTSPVWRELVTPTPFIDTRYPRSSSVSYRSNTIMATIPAALIVSKGNNVQLRRDVNPYGVISPTCENVLGESYEAYGQKYELGVATAPMVEWRYSRGLLDNHEMVNWFDDEANKEYRIDTIPDYSEFNVVPYATILPPTRDGKNISFRYDGAWNQVSDVVKIFNSSYYTDTKNRALLGVPSVHVGQGHEDARYENYNESSYLRKYRNHMRFFSSYLHDQTTYVSVYGNGDRKAMLVQDSNTLGAGQDINAVTSNTSVDGKLIKSGENYRTVHWKYPEWLGHYLLDLVPTEALRPRGVIRGKVFGQENDKSYRLDEISKTRPMVYRRTTRWAGGHNLNHLNDFLSGMVSLKQYTAMMKEMDAGIWDKDKLIKNNPYIVRDWTARDIQKLDYTGATVLPDVQAKVTDLFLMKLRHYIGLEDSTVIASRQEILYRLIWQMLKAKLPNVFGKMKDSHMRVDRFLFDKIFDRIEADRTLSYQKGLPGIRLNPRTLTFIMRMVNGLYGIYLPYSMEKTPFHQAVYEQTIQQFVTGRHGQEKMVPAAFRINGYPAGDGKIHFINTHASLLPFHEAYKKYGYWWDSNNQLANNFMNKIMELADEYPMRGIVNQKNLKQLAIFVHHHARVKCDWMKGIAGSRGVDEANIYLDEKYPGFLDVDYYPLMGNGATSNQTLTFKKQNNSDIRINWYLTPYLVNFRMTGGRAFTIYFYTEDLVDAIILQDRVIDVVLD